MWVMFIGKEKQRTHFLIHYMHMDTNDIMGIIILTFAIGAGLGYYAARIFFGA